MRTFAASEDVPKWLFIRPPAHNWSVHVLTLECAPEDHDRLIAGLWERGTAGILADDLPGVRCALRAFFDVPFPTDALAAFSPSWQETGDRDWVEVSRSQWEPVLAGERFFLVPAWRDDPAPPGRMRLDMEPAQACGTGWGPATQLALEAMERALPPGGAVLDLGTGSGILAVAAGMLGAGRVFACDIDFQAALEAAARCRRDNARAFVYAGSLRSVRTASIDFLVANINAETIAALAPEIERVLTPHGAAALTGFPARHLDRVRSAFNARGDVLEKGEWRALIVQAAGSSGAGN